MYSNKFFYTTECKGLTYSYTETQYSPVVPPHFHDGYEIYLFLEGDAVYSVEGNIYQLKHNDILFTNSRELHSPIFKSNAKYTRALLIIKMRYLSEFIGEQYNPFLGMEQRKAGELNKINASIVEKYGLDEKFGKINYYSRNNLPESCLMIKTYTAQIVAAISSILSITEKKFKRVSKVQEVIQYINQNLNSNIRLDTLEDIFHLNKFHLSHLFKAQTGYTIGQYIAQKRILMAKDLLTQNIPISDVASTVGFSEYSNFYKTFKNITGVSPQKFVNKL